jgi:hypothetical protein
LRLYSRVEDLFSTVSWAFSYPQDSS